MDTNSITTLPKSNSFVGLTGFLLVATVWISAGIFGLYIVAFYGRNYLHGTMENWNGYALPNLYEKAYPLATAGVALHFLAGGIILVLGSIQFIEWVRQKFPVFHRWLGRVYVVACALTAIGGLTYIIVKGTIGGMVMNIGFSGYGLAMLLCAVLTMKFARDKNFDSHRAWAIRLYALAIGSWLYRMYYGFTFFSGVGWHQSDFRGTFDIIMTFFFWVPNLLVAEFFIRSSTRQLPRWVQVSGSALVLTAILFIAVGTYHSTRFLWGPVILEMFGF
jgi:uncharacterized membrane protein